MKIFTRLAATVTFLSVTSFSFAASLNPGWYMGAFAGGGSMGSLSFPGSTRISYNDNNAYTFQQSSGTRTFGLLGDLGLDLGYRYCNFRVEGAFLFGGTSVKNIRLNNSSTILIPPFASINLPPNTYKSSTDYKINTLYANINPSLIYPNTNLKFFDTQVYYAGFANLLYDFYPNNVEVSFVPYVGVGIGYFHIDDTFNIDYLDYTGYPSLIPTFNYSLSFRTKITTPVAQGILGALYLVDDFSSVGVDFRYMISNKISEFENSRLKIYTLNLVFNYTFDTD